MSADPARHRLWENTLVDHTAQPLATSIDQWCQKQFGTPSYAPMLWPSTATKQIAQAFDEGLQGQPLFAVKLDVGGNQAKALPKDYERELLRTLVNKGWRVILDRGFGDEELAASDELIAALGWQAVDLADTPSMGLTPEAWQPDNLNGMAIVCACMALSAPGQELFWRPDMPFRMILSGSISQQPQAVR